MRAHYIGRLALGIVACVTLAACGGTDASKEDAARSVPGTSAQVNGKKVSPLHEGQYIGQLEVVGDGEACRGSSGSSATGSTSVTLYTDEQCRVFVESIEE